MTNPQTQLMHLPTAVLIADLLKQFNKPTLLGHGTSRLTQVQIQQIATAAAQKTGLPDLVTAIKQRLAAIIDESLNELQERFDLSFVQALQTQDISQVAHWETTADFLTIANIKSNAELRVSAGSALMTFLGDDRYRTYLWLVIAIDAGINDVDAMIAKRALAHRSGMALDSEAWQRQAEQVLMSHHTD